MMRLMSRRCDDAGVTLVELLIAMVLASILGGVVLTVVLGVQSSVSTTQAQQSLNEEARLALNRIARQLRQALPVTASAAILAVRNPDTDSGDGSYDPNATTSITFTADFNGDGCIDGVNSAGTSSGCVAYNANDPETLTYCWDPNATIHELFLIPGTISGSSCQPTGAEPILAGEVTSFKVSYRSDAYLADTSNNGITTWSELDAKGPPYGNDNGQLDTELSEIDSLVIEITASEDGKHPQSYTTEVDLRNVA